MRVMCTACTTYCLSCAAAGAGFCDAGMCASGYRRNSGLTCEGTTHQQHSWTSICIRGGAA